MMSDKDNNLLKSDILTVGSELSEKLNAIGVPNTFGKASEGKDNLMSIIRMTINGIDMIIEQIKEKLKDYYNKSEVNTLLNGKSDTSHNHDSAYASKNHNHDSAYASKNHNHDTAYASKSHQHGAADVILKSNNIDVGTEIGTIEDDITSLNGNITSINASITDINNTVNDHTGNITSINASITDINNTVNDHTTKFTNMIEKHTWSIPAFSLKSGEGVRKTTTVPNPSGYHRIPIIQGAYKCSASSLGLDGTTLAIKIQNYYPTNANASMYGIILYIKSSIIKEI